MTEHKGWDFWRNTLNSARLVVAPMVDQSELPWRMLSRKYGAELCYTPMFHASVFSRDAIYRRESLQTCDKDRPLIVQFCANDPEIFLKAAQLAEGQCDAIDLNLGCPQSIARRGHYGAFLQDDWLLLQKMVSLCNAKLKVPITCKIRVFESIEKTVEYAQMLEEAGCQLLTVHGRTKEQKGPLTGLANWEHIKAVRQNVKIPVFANGNIQYLSDVDRCIAETGVQGIMSAEGNLHNPALFHGISPPVWQMVNEYLEFVEMYPCSTSYIRGHVFKIMHHALEVHKDARQKVALAKTINDFKAASEFLEQKCQADVEKYEKEPGSFKCELPLPYWLCQPYVRPSPKDANSEGRKAERERLNLKRNAELSQVALEGEPMSKNKLKKKLRNPQKNFDPLHKAKYERCMQCCNPKGRRCEFSLCKSCCKLKSVRETLDCLGHNFRFRTRALTKSEENGHSDMSSVTNVTNDVTDSVTSHNQTCSNNCHTDNKQTSSHKTDLSVTEDAVS
ncbi:tRNA-dihydrouridine(16/17) synthase [NAD(P)(+)]-like [Gigantopelta aegis]|uniref:tRNA-dihydrouridine(16/17) synthase [NAD(P)(+)]-like n=1 Tax=Gigantopelta aegis TaxID=1735272 RepID=UPI001B889B7A|nr:tRNA-dihydrouridine(16/17) synthase [NAD(P)(+)]-like [Gigantopelta aegis]